MLIQYSLLHAKHVRRRYSTASFMAAIARSLRVLLYPKKHRAMLETNVAAEFLSHAARHNLFNHLNHRHYLANFLTLRERVDFALFHLRVEDIRFNKSYKRLVYLEKGLQLWEQTVNDTRFSIILRMAPRVAQEGDLEVALMVGEQRLHSYKFSWLDGKHVGHPGKVVPWLTCCQGLRRHKIEAPAQFNAAFPNNWPKLFCLAAVRSLANAVGSEILVGIPGHSHASRKSNQQAQFHSTYDEFWLSQHGVQNSRYGYMMPARLPEKDLSTVPSKHRKRAENRRQHWIAIETAASQAISAHLNVR